MAANYVEATWTRTFKVWWSLTWRTTLFSLPISVVLGAAVGLLLPPELIEPIAGVVGTLAALIVAIWVARRILNEQKAYSDFRIALIEKEQPARLLDLESEQEPLLE